MVITGVELAAISAGISSVAAYYGLVTAMAHLAAATTLGAAAAAVAHGVHSGIHLARGLQKIMDSELRALVRVNYTHNSNHYKETFVVRKQKHDGILKIYKVETESLIFHRGMATSHTWTLSSEFGTVDCSEKESGFVNRAVSSGLVRGNVQYKCLRMKIGNLIGLMAASLPSSWTGLVAELGEKGLMVSTCDANLKHTMLSGKMTLRYFKELNPLMTELVDVF
ncbi:unnamed protein product [Calypogeia fissa]